MTQKTAYPLCWPEGWKRTKASARASAKFGRVSREWNGSEHAYRGKRDVSVYDAFTRVSTEIQRLGVRQGDCIVSTDLRLRLDGAPRSDQREPGDPGAAVYWMLGDREQCMAIDRYDRVADNLAAIAATLEALRAIERHGGGEILERAFRGFAALPANATALGPAWRSVFGFVVNAAVSVDEMESRFRELAREHHSDRGGDDDRMRELIEARNQARRELTR